MRKWNTIAFTMTVLGAGSILLLVKLAEWVDKSRSKSVNCWQTKIWIGWSKVVAELFGGKIVFIKVCNLNMVPFMWIPVWKLSTWSSKWVYYCLGVKLNFFILYRMIRKFTDLIFCEWTAQVIWNKNRSWYYLWQILIGYLWNLRNYSWDLKNIDYLRIFHKLPQIP